MMNAKEFADLLKASNLENNGVLKKEFQDGMKKELTTFKEEIKIEIKDMVSQTLSITNKEIDCLKEKIAQKDDEIAALKERTMSLEFSTRKKNVILFKVAENEGNGANLIKGVSKLIREVADPSFTDSEIDDAYRLGKQTATGAPRPIMILLNKSYKRNYLLSQRKKFTANNVGIAEDLPKEVYQSRKHLYQLADKLRKDGKRVQFRMDKLVVDGKELSPEDIAEEEASQERKRKLSLSPEENTSNGRRTIPKLNLRNVETPKAQASLEQFFSPTTTRNAAVFEYVSDK